MNLKELIDQLQDLDPRDPGRWPFAVRATAVGATFLVLTLILVYLFVWQTVRPQLLRSEAQESQLRHEFVIKHSVAANLKTYQRQLQQLRRSFGALLRQLPSKTEVPNLLENISDTASAAGLQQHLFQPGDETDKAFYAVLPIKMVLTGGYHQFGEFASDIASLSRIVTLHDIKIKPTHPDAYDSLSLTLTADTYRYLTQEEIAAQNAKSHKGKFAHPPHRGPG